MYALPRVQTKRKRKPPSRSRAMCFGNQRIETRNNLGRCEASWGEPERDMTVSVRLNDSVFTETHGLEKAVESEYE